MKLDAVDRKLLALLQVDASLPVAELAARVHLSTTPCWRRVQRLKQNGVIRATVALVDRHAVGLPLTVFVEVRTKEHHAAWFEAFRATVEALPEVVEFYRMSGDTDYLLRLVVPDMAACDDVYKRLTRLPGLADVRSSVAMESLKTTTALPLGPLP